MLQLSSAGKKQRLRFHPPGIDTLGLVKRVYGYHYTSDGELQERRILAGAQERLQPRTYVERSYLYLLTP